MNNENNTEAYISYSANKIGLSVPAYVRYVWFRHDDYTVVHRRRLHGGDGGDCPHGQKSCGGDAPKTPPQEYCYVKFLKQ